MAWRAAGRRRSGGIGLNARTVRWSNCWVLTNARCGPAIPSMWRRLAAGATAPLRDRAGLESSMLANRRIADATKLIADLTALLGADRVSTNAGILDRHGHDESYHATHQPDVVVFPDTTAHVAAIAKIARQHQSPVIPFGVGTSLEGHVAALEGGVSID